jgi:hypothetical protein
MNSREDERRKLPDMVCFVPVYWASSIQASKPLAKRLHEMQPEYWKVGELPPTLALASFPVPSVTKKRGSISILISPRVIVCFCLHKKRNLKLKPTRID